VPCLNQFAVQILNYRHRFGGLTRGENMRGESVSHLQERAFKLFQEMWCDIIVSDNRSHPGESGWLGCASRIRRVDLERREFRRIGSLG
jgi:hypothetical protein